MTSIPDNHVRDRSRVQLRKSNAGSINYTNLAPMFCHEGVEIVVEIAPSRNYGWMIWPALLVGLGIAAGIWGWANRANASEPADHMRPHEITLLVPPGTAEVGIMTISGAYPDRGACEKAKQRVVVKAPGAKLVCGIANPWRVR